MTSTFASRLGTNYCPTDQEILEIKGLLIEPTLRLKRLDDEIADLQKRIERLAEERDSLSTYVEDHKALISPTRRLPLDIIEEIFVACLPTHRNCVMSATEAPVLLGRVCSSWRTISLATPRLWARLHVVEPSLYPLPADASLDEKVDQRVEVAKMWLSRSGQCPLSISLQSAPEHSVLALASRSGGRLLEALIPFAARWQHIDFTAPPILLMETLSYLETDMPCLETMAFPHNNVLDHHTIECGPFQMLRGARISGFSIAGTFFIPERFPVPWKQLTTLTIGGPHWSVLEELTSETILNVISGCPELRCCKVMINDEDEIPVSQHPIVELAFLHTLAIHYAGNVALSVSVLSHLSLPQLRNFIFLGLDGNGHPDPPGLADFLGNSIRLESLEIDYRTFSKSSFLECLRGLPPTLRRLRFCDTSDLFAPPTVCVDEDTLVLLTTRGLFHALEHLSIDRGDNISDAAVLRFITARMLLESLGPGPTTLNRVEIHFCRQLTLDIMPSLQPFIETGLGVSLFYRPLPPHYSPWMGLDDAPPALPFHSPPLPHW